VLERVGRQTRRTRRRRAARLMEDHRARFRSSSANESLAVIRPARKASYDPPVVFSTHDECIVMC